METKANLGSTNQAVVEVVKWWREKIGQGGRGTQPWWQHVCEMLKELELALAGEGNLKT